MNRTPASLGYRTNHFGDPLGTRNLPSSRTGAYGRPTPSPVTGARKTGSFRRARRIIIGANLATDLACVIGPAVLLVGVLSVTVFAR